MGNNAGLKYQMLPLYALSAVVGATITLTLSDSDWALPVFIAVVSAIFAVTFYFIGRIKRLGAVVTPVPDGDMQLFLPKLGDLLQGFGYRATPPAAVCRWDFEAEQRLRGSAWPRRISVELSGKTLARIVGSQVVLTRIRKTFPGTKDAPYSGPQPRGSGLLLPGLIAFAGLGLSGTLFVLILIVHS